MLSVIIAAYNAEEYLPKCLDSVLNQTFDNIEVLVVDDGSTDATWEIINRYSRLDTRIKPIRQDNKGPSYARNVAFDRMVGEYFTVIDADDWIDSTAYQIAMEAAIHTNADMVIWGYERFSSSGIIPQIDPMLKQGLYEGSECTQLWLDFIYREVHRVNPFVPCRLMKTSILNDKGLRLNPALRRSEDYMLLSQYHFYCKKIYSMSNNKFLHYRMNENSITHNYVDNYFKMVMTICEDLEAFAKKNNSYSFEFKDRVDCACIYRTFMAIENENYSAASQKDRLNNIRKIINSCRVKAAVSRIGIIRGRKLFGKKFVALRFNFSRVLLRYCKG